MHDSHSLTRSIIRLHPGTHPDCPWINLIHQRKMNPPLVSQPKIRVPEETVNKSNRKCVWRAVRLRSFPRNWPRVVHRRENRALDSASAFAWFSMHRSSRSITLTRKFSHCKTMRNYDATYLLRNFISVWLKIVDDQRIVWWHFDNSIHWDYWMFIFKC